ncbi:Ig-like domain-containing domain [Flavihumibacter petaseus]|uniref:SbsA Ig-like domain-containing protein n=1 Tax=Flavihumibacter petaseus NBRC 106054 TaxID=1220578 RepID=A0A0E9MWT7_9BACT|nr:Ig-like domain-containing domain [Flavihumibacter petaseus]GAO41963.1 hypothetical protein FPE01S_01_09760 [Flavihumibacter petaseus NBRC 106054]
MRSRWFIILFLLSSSILAAVLLEGCANIVPPLGGPRDSLPPRIVAIHPADSTLHFNEKKIEMSFDEYVTLENALQNVLVTPTPKVNPIVESRLKTVTVRIKDTLEANTTYVIDFGKAIRDVNEGNPLKNYRYIFSTGNYFDSLEFRGRVQLAETGKTDSTLIVMLHRDFTDSAVFKEKPRYYTRVDTTGAFHFQNLAPGTYAVYAVKDEGGSLRYMNPETLFAFADQPVAINGATQPMTLYAYAEPAPVKAPKAPSTTTTPKKKKDDEVEDKRLRMINSLEAGAQDVLKPLTLTFPDPLKSFDSTKLILTDKAFKPLPYTITRDTTNKIFTLAYTWPLDQEFHLISEKDMAADSLGKSTLKTDTVNFRTMKESDYGSIRFRFNNVDTARHPVLQLLQNGKVMYHYPITGKELMIRRFRPAEFEMNVLYDDNGNGRWDYGIFFGPTRRQPEIVMAIPRKLTIKGNWDNEAEITLK